MKYYTELQLPFHIPIAPGLSCLTSNSAYAVKCTFQNAQTRLSAPRVDEEDSDPIFITVTNIQCEVNWDFGPEITDLATRLRSVLWAIIEYMNRTIDGLVLATHNTAVRRFTVTDLPPILLIREGDDSYAYAISPLFLSPTNSLSLDMSDLQQTGRLLATWDAHPLWEVVDRFFASGIINFVTERFMNSVVDLQTSFEALISATMRVAGNHKGKSAEEIQKIDGLPLKNKIEHHLGKLLAADLSLSSEPMLSWQNGLYDLRNRIVHEGLLTVSSSAAYAALIVYMKTRDNLAALLAIAGIADSNFKVNLTPLRVGTPDAETLRAVKSHLAKLGYGDSILGAF